jgi:YD repeat-containing protein
MLFVLLLVVAGIAEGDDRTERIADSNGAKELVYKDDVLVEARFYDARGAIQQERVFGDSSLPIETRTYIREGGRIVRIESTDVAGNSTGSIAYRFDRNGRLLGVSSAGAFGAGSAGMIVSMGAPQGSWVSSIRSASGIDAVSAAETTVLGYDESGRVTIVQTMKNGEAISIEKRVYGEGDALASVRIENTVSGVSSEMVYDMKGRLAKRTETPAKGLQVKTDYRYDDASRLVEELSSRGGHRSARILKYDEGGAVVREETSRDGELLLALVHIENGRVEELYEDGSVFVRATYIGGRKVKDDFYLDGEIVRTREY